MDGYVWRGIVSEAFSTIRNGAGSSLDDTNTYFSTGLTASATTNQFKILNRSYVLFDTSAIGANGVISSSIFSGYYYAAGNTLGSTDLHLASSTPASNTGLVATDYQQIGRTSFGSITYANFIASQYNDITLNADGLASISKMGISKFSLQVGWDITGSFTGTWGDSKQISFLIYSAEQTDTSQDPKLVVTYTVVIPPKQDVIWFD